MATAQALQVSAMVNDGVYKYDGARLMLVPECPEWTAKVHCCCWYCATRSMGNLAADALANRKEV